MIMQSLWLFQKQIYKTLKENKNLSKIINSIYYKVPQDTKFPYITVNFDNIKDVSVTNFEGIKFDIIVNIFNRENGSNNLIKTGAYIEESINNINYVSEEYMLSYMEFRNANFTQHKDGITQSLKINFSAILRGKHD